MSRLEKRRHQEEVAGTDQDLSVRLFSWTNRLRGYQVVHSPEEELIILKTKSTAAAPAPGSTPCDQWKPFAEIVHKRNPNTGGVFVLDTTPLGEAAHTAELLSTNMLGPALRPAEKIFSRLNPKNCKLIAAGTSCPMALKLALFGRCSEMNMTPHLVFVCPPPLASTSMVTMMEVAARHRTTVSAESLTILVSGAANVPEWQAQGSNLAAHFGEVSVVQMGNTPLFQRLAALVTEDKGGEAAAHDGSRGEMRLFRINFTLSRYTKQIEQSTELVLPYSPDSDLEDEDEEEDAGETTTNQGAAQDEATVAPVGNQPTRTLRLFAPEYELVKDGANLRTTVEALVLGPNLVANAHGAVAVEGDVSAFPAKGNGVSFTATVRRGEDGSVKLADPAAVRRIPNKQRGENLLCPVADIPCFNLSAINRGYGCVLVRGSKVVLVRSLEEEFEGMRLPWQLHSNDTQSAVDCAVGALCHRCDITPDNFYLHPAFPSFTFYPQGGTPTIVTLFVAVATALPAGGVLRDQVEDEEDPDDSYDWLSFRQTQESTALSTAEKEVLKEVTAAVGKAHTANMYQPLEGLGLFGDSIDKVGTKRASVHLFCSPTSPMNEFRSLEGLFFDSLRSGQHPLLGGSVQSAPQLFPLDTTAFCPTKYVDECCKLVSTAVLNTKKGSQHVPLLGFSLSPDADLDVLANTLIPQLTTQCAAEVQVTIILAADGSQMSLLAPCCDLGMDAIDPSFDAEVLVQPQCVAALEAADAVVCIPHRTTQEHNQLLADVVSAINPSVPLFLHNPATNSFEEPRPPGSSSNHITTFSFVTNEAPLHPATLSAFLDADETQGLLRQAGVICASGQCWVASRPARRGTIQLQGGAFALEGGEPWWCTVDAEQRPSDVEPRKWHPVNGDRLTEIHFVTLQDAVDGVPVGKFLDGLLRKLLCPPSASWEALDDPLEEWAEDEEEEEDDEEDE